MFLTVKDGKATTAKPSNAYKKKFRKDCFEIRMFHVGHGECIVVSSPDKIAWLIDAGQGTGEKKNKKLADQIVAYLDDKKLIL
ncbi:MAG: hypothetical protein IH945_05190, partial [Armatimonadetes bacterium]|nr:hypothetical protein [Armatimonadota bacterium]